MYKADLGTNKDIDLIEVGKKKNRNKNKIEKGKQNKTCFTTGGPTNY